MSVSFCPYVPTYTVIQCQETMWDFIFVRFLSFCFLLVCQKIGLFNDMLIFVPFIRDVYVHMLIV